MCDVVFFTPNMSGKLTDSSTGTLQLATILKESGMSCEIIPFFTLGDIADFPQFVENAIKAVELRKPRIVSFYTRCDVYHIVLRLAEQIKQRWEDMTIVLGGPQSDICAQETLESIPWVDFICCGEGERTVYPFFKSVLDGAADHSVPGLTYRNGNQVVRNARPAMIEDLDEIPLLDYSLLTTATPLKDEIAFGIDVGRGCPFSCVFCSTKSFWGRKFRLKSPQRICDEMQRIYDMYGITRFKFSHDMFTLNREKVIETCQRIKALNFDAKWGCSARLDCIDKPLIDIMADAGLRAIYMGIETGSPRMQKLINKRLNLDRAMELAEYLKQKNIQVTASFIYGFPEETEEDVSQTLSLMAKMLNLQNGPVQAHLCAFLVGTELTEQYKDELKPAEVYSDQTGTLALEECKDLIDRYPVLFRQMMEYQTELRGKLRYFQQFWNIWQYIQPVYQYISEGYPEQNLIQMYYDFVEENRELLEKLDCVPEKKQNAVLINEDRFYLRLSQDANFDIISDIYRMKRASVSPELENGGTITDVYCVSPESFKKYSSLRDYPRVSVIVRHRKGKYEYKEI